MEFRRLGRSGLKISEITYGNWITHGSQVTDDLAIENNAGGPGCRYYDFRHRRCVRGHKSRRSNG